MDISKEIAIHHLANCRDIDNLIIKGHILTEHFLNKYIESMAIERVVNMTRFSYHHKLEIAQMLGMFKKNKNLKTDLQLLNQLRNSIAHTLEYDKIKFKTFINLYKGNKRGKQEGSSIDAIIFIEDKNEAGITERIKTTHGHIKFAKAIAYTCGILASLCDNKNHTKSKSTDENF
jgi:hypothetical protein